MPRVFLAVPIELTPELRQIARRLELLGKSIRAVPRNQWHVTVKFVGEISEALIPELKEACAELAPDFSVTRVRLTGIGVFPHLTRPQVVWCGLSEADSLIRLAEQLETGCERLGIPRERRPFHPHLTLARVKSKPPPELRHLIEEHQATSFGEAFISQLILFRSVQTPQGSIYTPLGMFPFAEESVKPTMP